MKKTIILLFVYSIILTSCKQEGKIILAENASPLSALTIIAHENGYFKEEGLDIQVSKFTSGKAALTAVLSDQADIATVAETPLVFAALNDQKFKIFGTIVYSDNDCKVVARSDKGIKNFNDLKDKKIGVLLGSNAEFFFSKIATINKANTKTMDIRNLNPPEMLIAIKSGDIDAFAAFEPFIAKAKRQSDTNVIVLEYPGKYTASYNLVISNNFYRKFDTEHLLKFLKALIKSEDYINKNKADAIRAISKYTEIEQGILEDIWKYYNIHLILNQSTLTNFLKEQRLWAITNNPDIKNRELEFSSFFDARYLSHVDPKRVTK